MRTIELTTGIHSSVIGFGCAPILGSKDAKASRNALDFAIDHGINHLDLARSYGYGEAEEFVGKAIAGKRKNLVLASKFGIEANWKALLLKGAKPFIRAIKGNKEPAKKDTANNGGGKFDAANIFLKRIEPLRATDMRRSLEKSLKKLQTDYLDYFFIHEPLNRVTYIDELIDTANRLKAEGKIRAFGIAYMQSQLQLHADYINKFDLLQFSNPIDVDKYDDLLAERKLKPNIIFSPFRGGPENLTPAQKMEKLLEDFPSTVLLCSMFNTRHIEANIKLAEQVIQKTV